MKNLLLLGLGNVLLEAPVPLLVAVGSLAGLALAPEPLLATLPAAAQMSAGIFTAHMLSNLMGRRGRRAGFILASFAMILGGILAITSMITETFLLLLLSHFTIGIAIVGINFFRFAAADCVELKNKSKASAGIFATGGVAVIIGSISYGPANNIFAEPFVGIYCLVAIFGALSLFPMLALSPDLGRTSSISNTSKSNHKRGGSAVYAIITMSVAHAVMLLVMSAGPIAAQNSDISQTSIGFIMGAHIFLMFAPGVFTGYLIDKFGPQPVQLIGCTFFIGGLSCASFSLFGPNVSVIAPIVSSGLGWNFMFLSGTHILSVEGPQHQQKKNQGNSEFILAVTSLIFASGAGAILQYFGWSSIGSIGIAVMVAYLATSYLLKIKTRWFDKVKYS